jgi:glycosyltransferase involved in cell wall biosynthesis
VATTLTVQPAVRTGQILHILDSGATGGGPRILTTTARGLKTLGWESRVLCGDDGPLAQTLAAQGIAAEALPIAGKTRFAAFSPALLARLVHTRPEVVILYGPIAASIGGVAARLARVPCILYHAGYPAYYADHDPLRRLRNALVERVACGSAHAVWCISSADRALYTSRRATQPDKLHLIPLGVSRELLDGMARPGTAECAATLRAQLGVDAGAPVVVYVGRLVPEKGVDVLLRALPGMLASQPCACLVIAGDGPERPELERLARELGVAGQVHFVGTQHDVLPYYRLATVVAVPSRYEPFGLVAVEAMAAGRPVVASRVGGLAETVVDGTTGRQTAPADPQALAEGLLGVLCSPEDAARMGAAGRERVRAEYTEERMVARVHDLIVQCRSR